MLSFSSGCVGEINGTGGGAGSPAPRPAPPPSRAEADAGRVESDGGPDDQGSIGSAGQVLLSPANAAVAIEVDRSPKARLEVDARQVVGEQLHTHGGKESIFSGGDGEVRAQDVYTADDLRSITASARQTQSKAEEPSIYVLILEAGTRTTR